LDVHLRHRGRLDSRSSIARVTAAAGSVRRRVRRRRSWGTAGSRGDRRAVGFDDGGYVTLGELVDLGWVNGGIDGEVL
jgi:hypothetical protein